MVTYLTLIELALDKALQRTRINVSSLGRFYS